MNLIDHLYSTITGKTANGPGDSPIEAPFVQHFGPRPQQDWPLTAEIQAAPWSSPGAYKPQRLARGMTSALRSPAGYDKPSIQGIHRIG